jgi:hypothetical protein
VGKKISALSVLLLLLVCFGGCGGSGQSSSEVPVAVSISDQPSNVGVLSFDIQITSACLLTSANAFATDCSGAQSLLPDLPMTVQLENMQTSQQSDVLATTSVAPGTYTAVLITFGTATVAVNVDPNSTDKDTATPPNSCTAAATPAVCELSPTLTPSFVNVPFPNAVKLSGGQPTNVSIEFSVADSLVGATAGTTTTFTINPIVGVGVTTVPGGDGNLIDVNNVDGPVTSVLTSSFTLTDSATGQAVTVTPDTNATFSGFSSCSANNLTCVLTNQIVSINYSVSDTSPLVLSATSVTDDSGFTLGQAFEGTIVATTPTPMVLVTQVPAGNTQDVTVGEVLTLVLPATSAGFSVGVPAGQTLPAGLTFAGSRDLVVGQNVLIDSTGITTAGDISTTTADQIELEPTQFSGTVSTITSPNLTVNGLNNFFNDNAISTIQVQTGTQTTFGGSAANGFNGITVGDQANFDGFLFNGGAGQSPIVFGENIVDNGVPAEAVKPIN